MLISLTREIPGATESRTFYTWEDFVEWSVVWFPDWRHKPSALARIRAAASHGWEVKFLAIPSLLDAAQLGLEMAVLLKGVDEDENYPASAAIGKIEAAINAEMLRAAQDAEQADD